MTRLPRSGGSRQPGRTQGESDEELLAQCRVDTFRSGGKGGQHQNTTESGVRLTHFPTGIVVTARDDRSQHRNRKLALERLRRRLRQRSKAVKRRIATRVPAREKRKRMDDKRHRSRRKRDRKSPEPDP